MNVTCSTSGYADSDSFTHEELIARDLAEEIRKYVRFLPQVAEPNMTRVQEIKEQIEKGTYLTPEIIQETAARLVFRFLRKE